MVRAMVGGMAPEEQSEMPVRVTVQASGNDKGLTVDHLSAESQRGALRDVTLHIAPGEQVGVTGLLSAGVVTLGRAVAGVEPWTSGRVLIDGKPLTPGRRDLALKAGAGYVPEDRMAEGFVAHLSVAENVTMTVLDELAPHTGIVTPARREAAARPYTEALSVVSSSLRQAVAELSGGNQQKVAVARALIRKPAVIVAITPTRGVDVASKVLLLRALSAAARDQGAALLLATDDLSDLAVCDRVIVLVRGERFTEFDRPPFDREALLAATEGLRAREELATEGLAPDGWVAEKA
jgi:simple sugar transport system ATP-binding protein